MRITFDGLKLHSHGSQRAVRYACALSCVALRCGAESVVNVALQLAAIVYTERIRRRNANNKAPPVHYTGGAEFLTPRSFHALHFFSEFSHS